MGLRPQSAAAPVSGGWWGSPSPAPGLLSGSHPALGCFLLSRHLLETPPAQLPHCSLAANPLPCPRSCGPVTRRPTPRLADSWAISPWPELPEEGVCTASPARGATSGLQSELESLSQQIRVEAGLGPDSRDALGAPLPGSLSALPGPPTPAPEEEARRAGQAPAPRAPEPLPQQLQGCGGVGGPAGGGSRRGGRAQSRAWRALHRRCPPSFRDCLCVTARRFPSALPSGGCWAWPGF